MIITAIQAILIAFVVGLIVGGFIGWKMTFNMRLVKIQEQQVIINKLRDQNGELKSKIRNYNAQRTKDKVSQAASAVSGAVGSTAIATGQAVASAGGAVGNVASSIKGKIWPKKKKKEDKEIK